MEAMDKLLMLALAVVALCCVLSAQGEENIDIHVNVDSDSKVYHQFKTREGSFNYGYNVAKKKFNQFQHKVRGPDDVTYGCYGFVDPENGTHLYHYVSDLKGYRVVAPNKTTKIYRKRVADSVKQLLQSVEESLPWEKLYFPEVCRHLYLSHKETNQFVLPPDYDSDKHSSLTAGAPNAKAASSAPKSVPVKPVSLTPYEINRRFSGPDTSPNVASPKATSTSLKVAPASPYVFPASPRATPSSTKAPVARASTGTRPTTKPATTAAPKTARPTTSNNQATQRPTAPRSAFPARNDFVNNFNVPAGSVTIGQGSPSLRVSATTPSATRVPPTTFAPRRTNNDRDVFNNYPSKIVEKPIEIQPNFKPTVENGFGPRRPLDNSILNLATTQSETVLIPNDLGNPDLIAIGQDIQEVKATLQMLISHILSKNADCNTPSRFGSGPAQSGFPGPYAPDVNQRVEIANRPATGYGLVPSTDLAPARQAAPGSSGALPQGGQQVAYLPLILTDFVPGVTPYVHGGGLPTGGHPLGALKLALPAYPAQQPPQCPVCRSDRSRK